MTASRTASCLLLVRQSANARYATARDAMAGETLQTSCKVGIIGTKAIFPGMCPWLEDSYPVLIVDGHPDRKGPVARTKGADGLTSFAGSEPSTGLRQWLLDHHPRLEEE